MLAIRREETNIWERRAPLNPNHVQSLVREGVKVLIQPSTRRAYSMNEYLAAGAHITDDLSTADAIVGVKQPPIDNLIQDKTYMFFSHTIKAQPENMPLLDALLDKGIRLVDYEKILDDSGVRLVAFGKYAGVAGFVNILHGLGLRLLALGHHTPFMHVGSAHNYSSSSGAKAAIASLGREIQYGMLPESLGPLIFTFTGAGNVSQGAQEVFKELPHEFVSPDSLEDVVKNGDTKKVYGTVADKEDNLVRRDGGPFTEKDFFANPGEYKSVFFEKIARFSTVIVNGIFWAPGMDRLLTTEQCRQLHPKEINIEAMRTQGVPQLPQRLLAIADISCDLRGSLEFLKHVTTIDNPFVVYNAHTDEESSSMSESGVVLMSIDNLPAQLPREATDLFGSKVFPYIPDLLNLNDNKRLLEECTDVRSTIKDAVITYNGNLTEKFKYIAEMRKQRRSKQ